MQTLREDENYWMWIDSVFITHSHQLCWTATHCSVSGKWLSLNPSLHTWLNLTRERVKQAWWWDPLTQVTYTHMTWYLTHTLAYKTKRFSYTTKSLNWSLEFDRRFNQVHYRSLLNEPNKTFHSNWIIISLFMS